MKPVYVQLLFDDQEAALLDQLRGKIPRTTFIKTHLHKALNQLARKGKNNVEKE